MMVIEKTVQPAAPREAERCLEVLTRAFFADPPCRWIWPEAERFLDAFPRFARAFGGSAFEGGTAHHADYAGVALWLPPGASSDEEAVIELVRETVPPDRLDTAFAVFEEMDHWHPREPHWYLPLIGVDPQHQGRGLGSALLREALEQCDRAQQPAYLEATTSRNIRLYQRHGFEPLTTIQVAGCPPLVPMLRRPVPA